MPITPPIITSDLLQKFLHWLSSNSNHPLIFTGASGVGKTALYNQLKGSSPSIKTPEITTEAKKSGKWKPKNVGHDKGDYKIQVCDVGGQWIYWHHTVRHIISSKKKPVIVFMIRGFTDDILLGNVLPPEYMTARVTTNFKAAKNLGAPPPYPNKGKYAINYYMADDKRSGKPVHVIEKKVFKFLTLLLTNHEKLMSPDSEFSGLWDMHPGHASQVKRELSGWRRKRHIPYSVIFTINMSDIWMPKNEPYDGSVYKNLIDDFTAPYAEGFERLHDAEIPVHRIGISAEGGKNIDTFLKLIANDFGIYQKKD